ncbi:hypothetical protein FOL46_009025 [Perkinsus olseni]|uniref:Uncharacterized protein n=1 Tax=Perkinsus olseni TaxID=32597 RepID=A0A7J6MLR0_PEROL|nr:hypothetical protein FOL46_009025 [Perkinsus olseni]
MSTKGIAIAASFAVAFISNISLGDAAGALAYPDIHDDFPQLDDESIMQDRHGLDARCLFGDRGENPDIWSPAMAIGVWNSIKTRAIVCPKNNDTEAFYSRFTLSGVLAIYEEKGQPMLAFYERPPHDSGLDPLRDLENPKLREMVAHLKK